VSGCVNESTCRGIGPRDRARLQRPPQRGDEVGINTAPGWLPRFGSRRAKPGTSTVPSKSAPMRVSADASWT